MTFTIPAWFVWFVVAPAGAVSLVALLFLAWVGWQFIKHAQKLELKR